MGKKETVIVTVRVDRRIKEIIDKVVEKHPEYINPSDLVRKALNEYLKTHHEEYFP